MSDKMREALQALDKLVPAPSSKAHQFYKPHYDKIKAALTQQPESQEPPVVGCYDCGLPYGGDSWIEAVVPDKVWERIKPDECGVGAGLLCVSCIAKRVSRLSGAPQVPVWMCGTEPLEFLPNDPGEVPEILRNWDITDALPQPSAQIPNEQGKNRYGLDMPYFRRLISRELNRPLTDFRPDEFARVCARMAATADRSVLQEPEFGRPQPSAQVPEGWRTALENLLAYAWRQICMHEDTHRGGSIWEICDQCGARWADDEGGRPDFATPPEIEAAEELLAAPSIAEKDQ